MKKTIALILLFFTMPLFALDRKDIRVEIRYKVDDTTNTYSTPRWTDGTLNNRINIVQRNISQFTNCLYKRATSSPTAGQQEYGMPSDCRTIDRVSFFTTSSTSAYKKLAWVSMVGKDRDSPYWENLTAGTPTEYYERGTVIGLIPAPSSTYCYVSSPSLKIDYYAEETDLSADSDVPWSGNTSLVSYQYLIVLGVTIMCKQDDRLWGEVDRYVTEYNQGITLMKQFIFTKPDRDGRIGIK